MDHKFSIILRSEGLLKFGLYILANFTQYQIYYSDCYIGNMKNRTICPDFLHSGTNYPLRYKGIYYCLGKCKLISILVENRFSGGKKRLFAIYNNKVIFIQFYDNGIVIELN